jgi:hypothetical protein
MNLQFSGSCRIQHEMYSQVPFPAGQRLADQVTSLFEAEDNRKAIAGLPDSFHLSYMASEKEPDSCQGILGKEVGQDAVKEKIVIEYKVHEDGFTQPKDYAYFEERLSWESRGKFVKRAIATAQTTASYCGSRAVGAHPEPDPD